MTDCSAPAQEMLASTEKSFENAADELAYISAAAIHPYRAAQEYQREKYFLPVGGHVFEIDPRIVVLLLIVVFLTVFHVIVVLPIVLLLYVLYLTVVLRVVFEERCC